MQECQPPIRAPTHYVAWFFPSMRGGPAFLLLRKGGDSGSGAAGSWGRKELRTSKAQQATAQKPLGAACACSVATVTAQGPSTVWPPVCSFLCHRCLAPSPCLPSASTRLQVPPFISLEESSQSYFQEYLNFIGASEGCKRSLRNAVILVEPDRLFWRRLEDRRVS